MTKANLIVLCASLCLGFSAPAQQKEKHKAHTATVSAEQKGKGLLADQLEIKKKISSHRRLRDAELKRQLEREALQAPSEELYGENSWTDHVNPFAGMSVNVPQNYNIKLDGFAMPLERRQVTSHYGYRSSFGRMHYGTDLALSVGDTVRAAFSGKIRVASYEGGGYGNYIVIRHTNGLETVYGHLHRRIVSEGTIVKAGDPIGLGGNTGRSTGPHLHFEARFMGIPLNPAELFDFHDGTPRLDYYTFDKSNYRRQVSRFAAQAASRAAERAKEKEKEKDSNDARPKTHRVKRGETIFSIAKQHDISVDKLKSLNGIKGNKLKAGKSLRIA